MNKQHNEIQAVKTSSAADCYKAKAVLTFVNLYCECGWVFTCYDTHIECGNSSCKFYKKKFKIPTIELEVL